MTTYREVMQMLQELEQSDRTGPKADALLQRCQRILIRSARADGPITDPDRPPPPDDDPDRPPPPPDDNGDRDMSFQPPSEPRINKPTRRDFIYDAGSRIVEAVSGEAKQCQSNYGKVFSGEYAMAKALSSYTKLWPNLLPVMEVRGKMPEFHPMVLGRSQWSKYDPRAIWFEGNPVDAVFIGGSPDAEIGISIGGADPTSFGDLEALGLWDLGIRGANDSFIIRQQKYLDSFLMDGCWWVESPNYATSGDQHSSGMHFSDGYNLFVWRNHKFKGCLLREHLFYDKAGIAKAGTFLIGNDLKGGNRTGTQRRPHPPTGGKYGNKPGGGEPFGVYVARGNKAVGYGFTHGSGPENADGGSCLTNWCNPNADVWYIDNEITDARYGCLTTAWQPASAGPDHDPPGNFVNEQGRTFDRVFLLGNTFENKRGNRSPVALSAANEIHLIEGNTFEGYSYDLVFDARTPAIWGAPLNGQVFIHTASQLEYLKTKASVGTYDRLSGKMISVTDEQLEAMYDAFESIRQQRELVRS